MFRLAARRWLSSSPTPPDGLFAGYDALLARHPLPTKAITSGLICGAGDCACQLIQSSTDVGEGGGGKAAPFSVQRLANFTFLGGALVGPTLHVWYGVLNRKVTQCHTSRLQARLACGRCPCDRHCLATGLARLTRHKTPNLRIRNNWQITGDSARAVLTRLGLDQLVFAPLFIPTFMASISALEGRAHEIPARLREVRRREQHLVSPFMHHAPCTMHQLYPADLLHDTRTGPRLSTRTGACGYRPKLRTLR